MLRLLEEKAVLLNSQYEHHREVIERIICSLLQQVESLVLPLSDLEDAKDYIRDKVNLFRYLRCCDFDEKKTETAILDTIQWRAEHGIGHLTWESVAPEFFGDGGFAFFHKQDRLGRPVAVVRMRYFPQFRDKSKILTELMRPYACLVMEIARKWMRDITLARERDPDEPRKLVSQIAVIIDIGKAPFIPIDAQLVQTLIGIMDKRFPGMIGSIYVMNFGWMYQGLWQMIKYVLSDEARSRISFPSSKEVLEVVPEENLLQELGGTDPYEWSLESDIILQKYATPNPEKTIVPSPLPSPVMTPVSTRSSQSPSISSSPEEFYDAPDTFSDTTSTYATPGTMTPIELPPTCATPSTLWLPARPSSRAYSRMCYWTGLHMGAAFMESFLGQRTRNHDTEDHHHFGVNGLALMDRLIALQEQQLSELQEQRKGSFDGYELAEYRRHTPHFPHLLPPDDPQSAYALAPVRVQIHRIEFRLIRLTRRLFRLSFAYKGAIYWVLLYIFLRGPVEQVIRRSLATVFTTPQKITYTTIGLTAAIAATIGSSITASLERPRS